MDYSTAKHYAEDIQEIKIMIRRAGPNYIEGLRKVKAATDKLGFYLTIYGAKTHITAVIHMALDIIDSLPEPDSSTAFGPPARKLVEGQETKASSRPAAPPPRSTRLCQRPLRRRSSSMGLRAGQSKA